MAIEPYIERFKQIWAESLYLRECTKHALNKKDQDTVTTVLHMQWARNTKKNELLLLFFLNSPLDYSKASVNAHDGTKILKNHVKPKIALTELCIMNNGSSKYSR